MKKILVTGSLGQIGSELTHRLRSIYGNDRVVASDVRLAKSDQGLFELMDVLNPHQITRVMQLHQVGTIYHLAALLSAVGEARPSLAWDINVNGLYNVLEAARQYKCAVFFPSSIGVFGTSTPKVNTPQVTIQRPSTMYGLTKLTGELLCDYYFHRFGVDTRGLRFPGLISHDTQPGGGTTDYAVDIFYEAIKHKKYTCYLNENTSLDMMYMPDALDAMLQLMEADSSNLIDRNAYNVSSMQFTPKSLSQEIEKHVPGFKIFYQIDPVRQAIANSWPDSMDSSHAKDQWGFDPKYDFQNMVKDMYEKICDKLKPKFEI